MKPDEGQAVAPRKWTRDERQDLFIEALSYNGDVKRAAKLVGIAKQTVYNWREADGVFATRWDAALKAAAGHLESHAIRRGTRGWLEPVFYEGEVVGYKRKFSDTLLIHMLRVMDPQRHAVGVDPDGASSKLTVNVVQVLKDEYAAAIERARRARAGDVDGSPVIEHATAAPVGPAPQG